MIIIKSSLSNTGQYTLDADDEGYAELDQSWTIDRCMVSAILQHEYSALCQAKPVSPCLIRPG